MSREDDPTTTPARRRGPPETPVGSNRRRARASVSLPMPSLELPASPWALLVLLALGGTGAAGTLSDLVLGDSSAAATQLGELRRRVERCESELDELDDTVRQIELDVRTSVRILEETRRR